MHENYKSLHAQMRSKRTAEMLPVWRFKPNTGIINDDYWSHFYINIKLIEILFYVIFPRKGLCNMKTSWPILRTSISKELS
jgi:hypothetical protein